MAEDPSFAKFVMDHQASLLRLAWGLTGDRQLAEDLAQTALTRLWPRWSRVKDENPWAYLQRIVATTYATWWRRRWRAEVATGELPEPAAGRDQFAIVDGLGSVRHWLETLPPRQRAIVVLRFLADLSIAETAAAMGCTEGTVKSQTAKALSHLRVSPTASRSQRGSS